MTAARANRAQQRALKETPKRNVFSSSVSKVHILETDLRLCPCGICSVHPAENLLLRRCVLTIQYVVQPTLVKMCLIQSTTVQMCRLVPRAFLQLVRK